jgi:hypothetical protein
MIACKSFCHNYFPCDQQAALNCIAHCIGLFLFRGTYASGPAPTSTTVVVACLAPRRGSADRGGCVAHAGLGSRRTDCAHGLPSALEPGSVIATAPWLGSAQGWWSPGQSCSWFSSTYADMFVSHEDESCEYDWLDRRVEQVVCAAPKQDTKPAPWIQNDSKYLSAPEGMPHHSVEDAIAKDKE